MGQIYAVEANLLDPARKLIHRKLPGTVNTAYPFFRFPAAQALKNVGRSINGPQRITVVMSETVKCCFAGFSV